METLSEVSVVNESPQLLKTTADLLAFNRKKIQVAVKDTMALTKAKGNFEVLIKEESAFPLTTLDEVMELIQQSHQLTELILKQSKSIDTEHLLLTRHDDASHFYFKLLQKTTVLESSANTSTKQTLLAWLAPEAQFNFYVKAGQLLLEHKCYQEAACYLGYAKTITELKSFEKTLNKATCEAKIEQTLTQIETEVIQAYAMNSFEKHPNHYK